MDSDRQCLGCGSLDFERVLPVWTPFPLKEWSWGCTPTAAFRCLSCRSMRKFVLLAGEPLTRDLIGFTIGRAEIYDTMIAERLAEGKRVIKVGKRPVSPDDPEGYPGEWIWQYPEDACEVLARNEEFSGYAVYLVQLPKGWEAMTAPYEAPPAGPSAFSLTEDAFIVCKMAVASQSAFLPPEVSWQPAGVESPQKREEG